MATKTETTLKEYTVRNWKEINKCPECGGEIDDEGSCLIFDPIWEHPVYLKICKKCNLFMWAPNGTKKFPELWQRDQCKDYDDSSWQNSGNRIDYGMLNINRGGRR